MYLETTFCVTSGSLRSIIQMNHSLGVYFLEDFNISAVGHSILENVIQNVFHLSHTMA